MAASALSRLIRRRAWLGWTAAVVADQSGPRGGGGCAVADMAHIAAQVRRLSRMRTISKVVRCSDALELKNVLRDLPLEVGAVYLLGDERERLRAAQSMLADVSARPVITEADAEAISVVGAVLTYLSRRRIHPSSSHVTLVGASRLPMLCPLLLTAGFFHLTMWNFEDAAAVPLWQAVCDADVVIDVSGGSELVRQIAWDRPHGSVIAPPAEAAGLLPVPGLIRAIAAASGPLVDVEVFHACAVGLMKAAPPGHLSPTRSTPDLVHEVASAAGRLLGPTAGTPPRAPRRPPRSTSSFWRRPSSRPQKH